VTDLDRVINRAVRRLLLQRMLRAGGIGVCASLAAAILVLAIDRGFSLRLPAYACAIIAGSGLIIAAALALLRRPPRLAAAALLDDRLALKDRLGTAQALNEGRLSVQGSGLDKPFSQLVERDAQRTARGLSVKPIISLAPDPPWFLAFALLLILAAGWIWLPEYGWARSENRQLIAQRRQELAEQRQQVADSLQDTLDELREDDALDELASEELDILADLAEQLSAESSEAPTPQQAREQSAAALNDKADELARQAERDRAAAEELTRRFEQLETPDPGDESAELARALREGDLDRAADALDDLLDNAESMDEQQRRALAEELRQLSEQLEPPAESESATPPVDAAEQIRKALEDQGLDEDQIDELLDRSPEDVEQQLRENDIDEQTARDIARDLQQQQREEESRDQAREDAEDIADALDDAAEDIEKNPPPSDPPPTDPPPSDPDQPDPPADQSRPEQSPQQNQPTDQQQQQPQQQDSGEKPQDQQTNQQTKPKQTPDQQPAEKPKPDQQTTEQESQQDSELAPQQTPQDAPGEKPQDMPRPGQGEKPQGDRPSERLREIDQRGESADERERAAERLREAARKHAGREGEDEERKRWELGEQGDQQQGSRTGDGREPVNPEDVDPFTTDGAESLDLTGEELADRIIAELRGDGEEGDPQNAQRQRAAWRNAREAAERAVDDDAVPARYHRFIKRYFDRLNRSKSADPPASSKDPAKSDSGS
jgi:hypothetical protein